MYLVVDTSSVTGQVLLFDPSNPKKPKHVTWGKEASHSEALVQKASEILTENIMIQLKEIIVVVGPGSFTGLRVGINFAKSLAYAFQLPIRGINSLHALLLSAPEHEGEIFAIVDAQKNALFVSKGSWENQRLSMEIENQHIEAAELEQHIPQGATVCGKGLIRYQTLFSTSFLNSLENHLQDISLMTLMGSKILGQLPKSQSWDQLQPLYLKKSAAEVVLLEKQ